MNKRNLLLLIFSGFLSLLTYPQETGYPIIRNYTPEEYHGIPQVMCVTQDLRGVMYFGVDGITEYDGVSWKHISPEKLSGVHHFARDSKGTIYVAAEDDFGQLSSDERGNTVFESYKPFLNDSIKNLSTVWFVRLTDEFVYFQTYDLILQYSPATHKIKVFKSEIVNDFTGSFVFNNAFFIRAKKKGLMKVVQDKLVPAPNSEFFKNNNAFSGALPYSPGTMFVNTFSKGPLLYQPEKDTVPIYFSLDNTDFINENYVFDANILKGGMIALGSSNKGLLLVDQKGKTLRQYDAASKLQNEGVNSILQDTCQNLWLALQNGISKTSHCQDLNFWNKDSGLKSSVIGIIRHKGRLYISTFTGIFYIDSNNQIQEVKNVPVGISAGFAEIKSLNVLLAGTLEGVSEIKEEKANPITRGETTTALYQSRRDSNLVFSTDGEFLQSIRYKNGRWVVDGRWDGVKDDIRRILEDEHGDVWLETYTNGIIRVIPDYNRITIPKKVQYYKEENGISSQTGNSLFALKNKVICGTSDGLVVYNPITDSFEPYSLPGAEEHLRNCLVGKAQEMPEGKIWLILTRNGKKETGYLNPTREGGYDWVSAPFNRIPEMNVYYMYVEPCGVAWFGGNEGLYRYDPTKDTRNYSQKYSCLVRKVTYGADSLLYGGSKDVAAPSNLEYKYNSLKFEFAAPYFDQEEKTLYSFQLEGFDKEWSKWGRQTEKEYTNLGEGTYTFKVKALNVYDVESETGTFQVTILSPFYRSWWAYCTYFLLLALIIVLIVKLYTHRLRAQKEHLEKIVKDRTEEILTQKNQLEKQTEQLQVSNQKLKELDEFKQGMTSIIVHDLKNPLNQILNATEKKGTEVQVATIQQSGKQMLNLILNILDVYKYEEVNMQLNLEPLQFRVVAKNAVEQVLFLSEKKEIFINDEIENELFTLVDKEISERILVNLLTNAIKYTPVNGRITLSSEVVSESYVRIMVSDTGDGIPEDKINLVFRKFGQIIAKKSGGVRSTGLGLTFCKMAVKAHGGEIGVKSQVGEGTTFWFTLQIADPTHAAIEIPKTALPTKKEPILFSEEERQMLLPAVSILRTFTIYETDDIEGIINNIRSSSSTNIQKWIAEIEKSLTSLNQIHYLALLEIT